VEGGGGDDEESGDIVDIVLILAYRVKCCSDSFKVSPPETTRRLKGVDECVDEFLRLFGTSSDLEKEMSRCVSILCVHTQ